MSWESYVPNSNGYFNENYGSYQNNVSSDTFYSSPSSNGNTWNTSSFSSSQSPSFGFSLLNLVDNCHSEAVAEKEKGIKPDFSECPWLKNPEGKRGRPAEYTKEEAKWAKWRNNWIWTEKQEMLKSIQNAERNLIQKTNKELKDEYFQLCLEAIVLSQNLCPHNQSTINAAMENPNSQKQICVCNENRSNGRFYV
uniref:Uncharacterized protein n=1 Tax=Panagrolaimus davidi TaxID=227884 RepID=A0A914QQI0_9BILA